MTNTSSGSNSTWGAFTPVMPAFIRLIAGVIVLVVIEAVVLGFPGISQNISGSTISIANIVVFMIGLVVALIVFKFGTQLAKAVNGNSEWTVELPGSIAGCSPSHQIGRASCRERL